MKNEEEMKHCILMRKLIEGEVVEKGLGSGSEKTMCFFVGMVLSTTTRGFFKFCWEEMVFQRSEVKEGRF